MQNSTVVFQLNFSNNIKFCAPKPARTPSYTRTDITDDFSETEIFQVQELQAGDESQEYETPNERAANRKVGEREVTTVKNLKSITSVIKDFGSVTECMLL